MSEIVIGVLSFLGGTIAGIVGMYFSDCRYLKKIQDIYETKVKRLEDTIETQKGTIDRLLLANNKYQIRKAEKKT
jgi:hypothetical protein